MVPTLILFGALLGRWWRTALVAGTLLWPALLLATGVVGFEPALAGAAAVGLLNTAVGVLAHQVVLRLARLRLVRLRKHPG